MALQLYFDHNVRRPVLDGLRLRGVDVLSALEDGAHQLPDPELLDRATALGRILFSQDADLLAEATLRQRSGLNFSGVIYAHQKGLSIGDLAPPQVLRRGKQRARRAGCGAQLSGISLAALQEILQEGEGG